MLFTAIDNRVSSVLRRIAFRLTENRRQAIEAAMKSTLVKAIQINPVDTARSRAAWVSSLEQLGGSPLSGWQGSTPTDVAEGRDLGHLERTDTIDTTELTAFNEVDYARFLEYGAPRSSPHAMAGRALHATRQQLAAQLQSLLD